MNKLSTKIIAILILTLMVTSIFPRMFVFLFNTGDISGLVRSNEFFIGMIITATASLLLFSLGINGLIIKRLRRIAEASQKIAQGNFDIGLTTKGHDEISALTKHFNAMAETLKANEYLHKDFVRNFSHELKTPISSIKGYAELIEQSDVSSQNKEYLKIIINESTRLSRLSQSMLQLSQIDSTKLIRTEEPFNVAEQIRNIIQLHQQDWEQKNIEFNLQLNDVSTSLHKDWLHLLWLNLITNAIRFSKQDGLIDIALSEMDGNLVFKITDHGMGIAEADQDKIFKLFFVADRSRSSQSSGLGLVICKTIVDKLDGSISYQSSESLYTTFIVTIPNVWHQI
jgi:signal transduction histidine kinase